MTIKKKKCNGNKVNQSERNEGKKLQGPINLEEALDVSAQL